jgi:hypothetical protein
MLIMPVSGIRLPLSKLINFDTSRDLNKNFILRLADCDFIDKKENVFITGSTGGEKLYHISPRSASLLSGL